jgi:hypothetical protein
VEGCSKLVETNLVPHPISNYEKALRQT